MDQRTAFTEYWKILDDLEDYCKEGYRRPHPQPPEFKVHLVSSGQKDELEPVRKEQIEETGSEIESCRACDLHLARKNAITGAGSLSAKLMIVLPPPDYEADDHQKPIYGEAREFLNKWIQAIGLDLEKDCYITNVVKCRPPGNRPPFHEELKHCHHFLQNQVDTVRPSMLLLLGNASLSFLQISPEEFDRHRGKPLEGPAPLVICTYDPFLVMKHPQLKRPVWEDLKILKQFIEHE